MAISSASQDTSELWTSKNTLFWVVICCDTVNGQNWSKFWTRCFPDYCFILFNCHSSCLLVLNVGNFWGMTHSNFNSYLFNSPSNPQQPIHSLRETHQWGFQHVTIEIHWIGHLFHMPPKNSPNLFHLFPSKISKIAIHFAASIPLFEIYAHPQVTNKKAAAPCACGRAGPWSAASHHWRNGDTDTFCQSYWDMSLGSHKWWIGFPISSWVNGWTMKSVDAINIINY